MIIVHSNIVTGCTRRKLLWKLFEQWHEKQFVGEMGSKKKRDVWAEILEAREIGETSY